MFSDLREPFSFCKGKQKQPGLRFVSQAEKPTKAKKGTHMELGQYSNTTISFGCCSSVPFMSTKVRKSAWILAAVQNVHAPVASAQTINAA